MARTVAIGKQKFDELVEGNFFLVDKTAFLADWWRAGDDVTVVCRPRRFGKTLTLDMVRCFLSCDYAGRGEELFGGLSIWNDTKMRQLQGTLPVVSLSFAACKAPNLDEALASMRQVLRLAVRSHDYLFYSDGLNADDRALLARVSDDMDDVTATTCLGQLCSMLERHWHKNPVVLLDEYDTPMQEAWLFGYWDGMVSFVRRLFNATFKTNPALGRALITGVTRVASESIFSDLNNPNVITTTASQYCDAFGFTEDEVRASLAEFGRSEAMDDVRDWYDGFTFGEHPGIYNPWSITCYLKHARLKPYWANSSSNALVSELVREGDADLKEGFEALLAGGVTTHKIDEFVSFRDLRDDSESVWGLLLATGYLSVQGHDERWEALDVALTNREVRGEFDSLVRGWFLPAKRSYNEFVRAMLEGRIKAMTRFLNDVALATFSSFDTGTRPSAAAEPERFWHGFVLGLLVDLRDRYQMLSNRESGYGRYDVMLVPKADGPAIVLEFKIVDPDEGERTLGDAVASALRQIVDKAYDAELISRGILAERIRHYGIAFEGKRCLVG